jgi:hypothetical protein
MGTAVVGVAVWALVCVWLALCVGMLDWSMRYLLGRMEDA